METLIEILKIIISWPTAIIVICVVLIIQRKLIRCLIERLIGSKKGKAKLGPVEIDFDNSTEETQKGIQAIEEPEPKKRKETESPVPEQEVTVLLGKLLDLLKNGEYREAQDFYNKEVKSNLDPDDKVLWYAYVLRRSHDLGDSGALTKLKKTVNQNKTKPEVIKQLAHRYKEMGEFEKARENYLLAIEHYDINDKHQRSWIVDCHVEAAWCLAFDDKHEQAIETLKQNLDKQKSSDLKATILAAMAYIAKNKELTEDFIFYAEASLNLNQLNEKIRFDLAYKYNEARCYKLALLHYQKLKNIRSDPVVLNNLGVCYGRLNLKAKSINSYQESAKQKETLAMGNLAFDYLDAGFFDNAKEVIDEAHKLSIQGIEVDAVVGRAKQRLDNIQKEEEETEKKLLKEAKEEREFRLKYSQARLADKSINEKAWQGPWETQWGEAKIEIDEVSNSFQANLHTKEEDKLAAALFAHIPPVGFLQQKKIYKEKYIVVDGKISGLTGRYTIRIDDTPHRTILGGGKIYRATGYMVINESCNRIEIMEKTADDKTDFKEWKKVNSKNNS